MPRSARAGGQAGLAIGKFVKEPFDEESRRNMFGQRAKEMAGKLDHPHRRHCDGARRSMDRSIPMCAAQARCFGRSPRNDERAQTQ